MAKILNCFLTCLILSGLFSCGDQCPPQPKKHHLLVFIDKSQSINNTAETFSSLLEAQLTPFFKQMIRAGGDRLEAHLIHGETVGNQSVVHGVFPDSIPCKCGIGPQDYENQLDDFKRNLERFRKNNCREIINYIEDKPNGTASSETDMLGSVEVISDFLANVPPTDTTMVIYISDMVHSQKEPRDYNIQPIKDMTEAKTCAAKDYTWLQGHRKFNPEKFANLKVHFIFPSGNYDKSQNDQMKYYWEELFGKINNTVTITRN